MAKMDSGLCLEPSSLRKGICLSVVGSALCFVRFLSSREVMREFHKCFVSISFFKKISFKSLEIMIDKVNSKRLHITYFYY